MRLPNIEKTKLQEQNEEQEKLKVVLEQQVQELSQGQEELEAKVNKMGEVNEFWVEKGQKVWCQHV